MKVDAFIEQAWGLTDEAKRKSFVRAKVHGLDRAELEARMVAELDRAGWNNGLLMVALRILQVVPSEPILHQLMAMIRGGVSGVPNGAARRTQLKGYLAGLTAKHPALADAAKRFGKKPAPKSQAPAPKKTAAKNTAKKTAPTRAKTAAKKTAKKKPTAKKTAPK